MAKLVIFSFICIVFINYSYLYAEIIKAITMELAIYTLTSELHDEQAINDVTKEFLDSLGVPYQLKGDDFSDYGTHVFDVIYVRTGGTESQFERLFPQLREQSTGPFLLLASGKHNSLPASLEIMYFLSLQGEKGEILHGSPHSIRVRLECLEELRVARFKMRGCRLGIIGEPSDWLISSVYDPQAIRRRLGIELVEIPMQTLLQTIAETPLPEPSFSSPNEKVQKALPGAEQIYLALKKVVQDYQLQGFTLRCFDLLTAVHNTGCLALARLNSEGIVAGCEGDVPALVSMVIAKAVSGYAGFQANPSYIQPRTRDMVFAHCTIPLNMVERYELDTHFESGIGVGIKGFMKERAPITLFKINGTLNGAVVYEGVVMKNLSEPDLCRTQLQVALVGCHDYFLDNPMGNHHIIIPGNHKYLLEVLMEDL